MSFAHPWLLNLLWLLPLVVLLRWWARHRRKRALARFAEPALAERLTGRILPRRRFWKRGLLLAGLAFMALALAGPRWGTRYQEVQQKGVDIMLVLDVSASMGVADVEPDRLERSRREILDLLRVLTGDRVGLVAFAGTAFLQCPLTMDYAALEMFLDGLEAGSLPVPGTDLGQAVEAALAAFDPEVQTDRVIVLITDGEDHEGQGLAAARRAAQAGVRVFIFGVGDPVGGPVPEGEGQGGFKQDAQGNLVLSKLDETGLRQMAALTGGAYVRSQAGDLDLDLLYFEGIRQKTEAAVLKSGKVRVAEERFPLFLLAAAVSLLLEGLLADRAPLPRRTKGGQA